MPCAICCGRRNSRRNVRRRIRTADESARKRDEISWLQIDRRTEGDAAADGRGGAEAGARHAQKVRAG